jgi:hypothetical protein
VAGFVGALLAVPVAAALAVIGERAQARRSSVALETPDFGEAKDEETPEDDENAPVDGADPKRQAASPAD